MTGKRADTLLQVMFRIEYFTLQRVCKDLTDDELFWEPTLDAWGIRKRSECRTAQPFGDGDWVADYDQDLAEPRPPMTTIGWLLWHVASTPGRLTEVDFLGGTHEMSSGWTSPYLTHHPMFTTAAAAVDALRDGWAALRASLERADDEQLEVMTARYTYAARPPVDGLCALGEPGPLHQAVFFVVGVLNEVSHHGSQICALRDFYAARPAYGVGTPGS